jgi:hypothetical protein
MGLDNGIEVKRTAETSKIEELKVFNKDWDKELKYDFEICYWRKCRNIRNMVMDRVEGFVDNLGTYLTSDDVDNIIDGLKSFNADNWDNDGGSIWEWDGEWGYSAHIAQDIKDLQLLRQLMDKYELEVYFYDSY